MKKISRPLLIGVLLLVLLSSACNIPVQTAAPAGTILPSGTTPAALSTSTELPVGTSTPLTPVIPITGENVVQMQCQFCVNEFPHAVLIFPDFAIFDVDSSANAPVTCLTAEVLNGKRVLVCSGTQLTTFNLKICSDQSNCLLFPVALQGCPLLAGQATPVITGTPMTPIFLTAINTLRPPTSTPKSKLPAFTQTPISPATSTTAPIATPTPRSTSYP